MSAMPDETIDLPSARCGRRAAPTSHWTIWMKNIVKGARQAVDEHGADGAEPVFLRRAGCTARLVVRGD